MAKELSIEETAGLARAYFERNPSAAAAEWREFDDSELADAFIEIAFDVGEKVREMSFQQGSRVSLVYFVDHFFGSDDAALYGPFRTIEEAVAQGQQSWGGDETSHDWINPNFRAAFAK